MFKNIETFNEFYLYTDEIYRPIIEYVESLHFADKLSGESNTTYSLFQLTQSHLIDISNGEQDLHLLLNKDNKIDIEGITTLVRKYDDKTFKEKLMKMNFNVNWNLTNINPDINFFYISLYDIPTIEQVIELKEMMFRGI